MGRMFRNILLFAAVILCCFLIIYIIIYIYQYYSFNDILLTKLDSFKLDDKGNYIRLTPNELGDSIGGILNPIVGLTAALLTGLAFYIQYQANRQVKDQFKLQQFESQFYEMLKLHKENVNEMEIEGYDYDKSVFQNSSAIYLYAKRDKLKINHIKDRLEKNNYFDQFSKKKAIKGRKLFFLLSKLV